MEHVKELITMDVYTDNKGIIADGMPEMEEYMREVLPNLEEVEILNMIKKFFLCCLVRMELQRYAQ